MKTVPRMSKNQTSMNLLRDGDLYEGVLNISGIRCAVTANFRNGQITVRLSTSVKCSKYFYDLKPMQNGKNDISAEVSRLYFKAAAN